MVCRRNLTIQHSEVRMPDLPGSDNALRAPATSVTAEASNADKMSRTQKNMQHLELALHASIMG
jgi:hypothetical protein